MFMRIKCRIELPSDIVFTFLDLTYSFKFSLPSRTQKLQYMFDCRWKLLMRVKYSIELLVRSEGIGCQLFLQSPRAKWCTHFWLCKNSSMLQSHKANDFMSFCEYSTEIDVLQYKFLWPWNWYHLWSSTKCNFAFI